MQQQSATGKTPRETYADSGPAANREGETVNPDGLFVPRGDLSDVVLNWHGRPTEKLGSYAEAYHSAARRLFETSPPADLHDINACPIVFLYRHSLELHLKEILINGQRIPQQNPSLPEAKVFELEHNLCALWRELEALCEKLGWTRGADLEAEGNIIREFNDKDPCSFSFRYPVTRSCNSTAPQNFRFDLRHFCQRMDQTLDRLEQISCGVDGLLSCADREHGGCTT